MTAQNPRQNPYIGPRSFVTGEQLYGRNREIRELLDLLIAERIVLLFSPSGAGKSSLIQAGLVPKLIEEGFHVLPPARLNLDPPAAFRGRPDFNRYVYSVLLSLEEDAPEAERLTDEELALMSLDEYLSRCPKGENVPDTIVVVFDQFEEVITADVTDRQAKLAFFAQLGDALRERKRWALFAIREDYVGALDPYLRPVPTRLANRFRLELLGAEAARQAIQEPVKGSGVVFQDDAAKKLVDDLRRIRIQLPDGSVEEQLGLFVEPVQLQVVCYRLFDHLPLESTAICIDDVESLGNVDTALADYYADRVQATSQATSIGERLIRDWFEKQLITEQGIRGQVLMSSQRSGGLDNQAIRFLVNAHLVRSEKRGGATWYELAHDRLIDPVRRNNAAWLAENLSVMQRQAALWETQGRPDSLLLSGPALAEARQWAEAHPDDLAPTDTDFLKACVDEADRVEAEEQARSAARLRRWNRVIAAFSALAIVLALLAAFFGYRSYLNEQDANRARNIAVDAQATAQTDRDAAVAAEATAQADRSLAIAAEATAQVDRGLAVTAKATAEAERARAEEQEALAIDRGRLARSGELAALSHNLLVQQRQLAYLLGLEALGAENTLQARNSLLIGLQHALNRIATQIETGPPPEPVSIRSVALSPDGSRLAYGADFGQLRVWDTTAGKFILSRIVSELSVNSVAFSPDGAELVTGDEAGNINVWTIDTERKKKDFDSPDGAVYSVAISPDGLHLAHAGSGRNIYVRDYNTTTVTQTLFPRGSGADVLSLAWSPDSQRLAAGDAVGGVRIFDVNTNEVIGENQNHEGAIRAVAWSQDGRWLASAGDDNRGAQDNALYLWNLDTDQKYSLVGHVADVTGVAFSPDGKVLASGDAEGNTLLWDVLTREKIDQFTDHNEAVSSVAFNREGKPLLATASLDRTINLYTIASQQPLGSLFADGRGNLQALGYTSPESLAMLGTQAGKSTIWQADVASRQDTASSNIPGTVESAAFGQGADLAALGRPDGSIEILEQTADGSYSTLETLQTGMQIPASSLNLDTLEGVAIDPDGKMVAAGVCAGATSRGGRCLQAEIMILDIATGQQIAYLQDDSGQLTGQVTSLAFGPDAALLVSGTRDGQLGLWIRDEAGSYQLSTALIFPRSGGLTSLAFRSDGMLLAVGNNIGEIILLDMATLSQFGDSFISGIVAVTSLAFSPDSNTLASGSQAGTVILWDLDVEAWKARACELAGRNLAEAEWQKYFPGEEYRLTCPQYASGQAGQAP